MMRPSIYSQKLLFNFYRSTVESFLTNYTNIWFASCTAADRQDLNWVVKAAQRIVGTKLPKLNSIYSHRITKKAQTIFSDLTHPGHSLFEPFPSGKRFRTIRPKTNRNSFYPRAVITPLCKK